MEKKPTICFVCSSGGHLNQLLSLVKAFEDYPAFLITERNQIAESLSEKVNLPIYLVPLLNRRMWYCYFVLFFNAIRSLFILLNRKPDVIITTGALCAVPVCFLGKWMGKKVVFIESFAKVTSPTLSGRLVYRIADLFLVQWESMLSHYPNAQYRGCLY